MEILNEKDFEYKLKDHGPKYICETKDFKLGLVRFGPGQSHKKHVHRIMDEIFYVIEGKADFYINDQKNTVSEGQVIHLEPGETHFIHNPYDRAVKMVLAATKTEMPDKIVLEE